MATVLTITANPLLDHLATAVITPGKVHRIERFTPVAGGKGLNVARVLSRHGHRVLAGGFLGGSSGEQLAALTIADGIEPCFTPIAASTRLGFLLTDPEHGGTTSVMENGPEISAGEIAVLVSQVRARLAEVQLVIISGGVPSASCHDLYRLLLDLCAQAGVTCWVDGYGPAMDAALAGPHPPALVKPNREEYGSDGRRWVVAHEIHLSDGGGELQIYTPNGRFRVTPPKVAEINAIGCGDCYVAALAHARLAGTDLIGQLRYAAAAGAANALRADVARIGPGEINHLVDLVQVTQLS
jgi:fructose-1-phosphate kinase PfkB-like protein